VLCISPVCVRGSHSLLNSLLYRELMLRIHLMCKFTQINTFKFFFIGDNYVSGHIAEETPGPISNPEVKLCGAVLGTALLGGAFKELLTLILILSAFYLITIKAMLFKYFLCNSLICLV